MIPINFPEANVTFGPPREMTEHQVRVIPAFRFTAQGGSCDGTEAVVVAWKPSSEELEQLNAGHPIYLTCLGGLPPHFMTTSISEATRIA